MPDRLIQPAKIVIDPIFGADFERNAYGYRPARGAVDMVKEVPLLPGWFLFVYKRERSLETSFLLSLLASVTFSSALVFRDVGGGKWTEPHPGATQRRLIGAPLNFERQRVPWI
jgi:hypothetical protein